jgi:predicted MFS family arabinose efflux permease
MGNEHQGVDTQHGRQHYTVTLAVLAVGALAFALLQTMVVPALPDMQRALHTSTTSIAWVLTIYLLSASVATPVVGRLGDIFGKEHTLLAVLVIFALGSLTCALSHSLGVLIIGRAIQGAGGAIFPLSFGIIRDEFPACGTPRSHGPDSGSSGRRPGAVRRACPGGRRGYRRGANGSLTTIST